MRVKFIEMGDRVIDLESGQLHHRGDVTQLSPRLLTLLNYFTDHAGRVLSRDDLIEGVWGHLEAASDDSVNVAVSALRRALGDNRRPHRVLKAVPRRGYLFESAAWKPLEDKQAAERIASALSANSRSGSAMATARQPLGIGLLVLALAVVIGLVWFQPWQGREQAPGAAPASDAATGPGVAVLPFTDMSKSGNQGSFADGLVDRIIHMLTLSPELDVVARTSSFAFRDSSATIREIGEMLQVDAVLEGSVQHSAESVRVIAQLIDAKSGMHIWSLTYDRPVGELFALQDEVANEVARTMSDSLLPQRDTPHPDSQRVWELITRGRIAMDRFTLAAATEAVGYFGQALELQPDSVEALIGLVDAIRMQRTQGTMRASDSGPDMTDTYLEQARALAPGSAMVKRATGNWHFTNGRPDEAILAFRRAIEINPNDAEAFRYLGRTLFGQARYDDAIEPLRTAVRLDPYSTLANVWLADAFWAVGRAEEALFRLNRIIQDQPDFPQSHDRIATYLAQTGATAQAMRHLMHARKLDPDSAIRWFRICEFWLQLGDDSSAEQCKDELLAEHEQPFLERYLSQIIHAFRGQWDAQLLELQAIAELDRRPDPLTRSLLAQAWSREDCHKALEIVEADLPEVLAVPPQINPNLLMATNTAVYCLQQLDRHADADRLLQEMSVLVDRVRLERGPWLVMGVEAAWLHALKGDQDAALTELERLVDDGWRYYWWGLDYYYPTFAPIVDHPRFHVLQRKLEGGVREQLESFEATRNEPLT